MDIRAADEEIEADRDTREKKLRGKEGENERIQSTTALALAVSPL